MSKILHFKLTFTITFGILLFAKNKVEGKPKLMCYFSNWEVDPPPKEPFQYDDTNIPYELCDSVVWYHDFITSDGTFSINSRRGSGFENRSLSSARRKRLPIYLAIGGYDLNLAEFRALASPENRRRFVYNVERYMKLRPFKSFLIDWGYPGAGDAGTYSSILQSLHRPFRANNWTLAITGPSDKNTIEKGYDLPEINKYVDEIHVNCHHLPDFFSTPTIVKDHSSLYADTDYSWMYSVESVMRYYSEYIPKEKLYVAVYIPGVTRGGGIQDIKPPYFKTCTYLMSGQFKEVWNPVTKTAHAIGEAPFNNALLTYENVQSLHEKASFVREKGYGGIAFKFVNDDDFRGLCGRKNALVKAVRTVFDEI